MKSHELPRCVLAGCPWREVSSRCDNMADHVLHAIPARSFQCPWNLSGRRERELIGSLVRCLQLTACGLLSRLFGDQEDARLDRPGTIGSGALRLSSGRYSGNVHRRQDMTTADIGRRTERNKPCHTILYAEWRWTSPRHYRRTATGRHTTSAVSSAATAFSSNEEYRPTRTGRRTRQQGPAPE